MRCHHHHHYHHHSSSSRGNHGYGCFLVAAAAAVARLCFISGAAAASESLTSLPNQTLLEVLQGSDNYEIFASLLNVTQLGPSVDNATASLTVFAPNDDAITNLDDPYVQYVSSAEWALHGAALASFHIVTEKLNASQIFARGGELPTLGANDNDNITIPVNNATRTIGSNGANITTADVVAVNGYIQTVDQVLIPDIFINTTVASVFFNDLAGEFTVFAKILEAAESYGIANGYPSVKNVLGSLQQFGLTLFLPTDKAIMSTFDADGIKILTNPFQLYSYVVATYHLIVQNINPTPLPPTPYGYYTNFTVVAWFSANSTNARINTATITATHLAGNGLINVIDQPLLPPDLGTQIQLMDHVGAANVSLFFGLVTGSAVNFPELFQQETRFTVFVPTNEAFDKETLVLLQRLQQPVWKRHLISLVFHHFYPGDWVWAGSLSGTDEYVTVLSGYEVEFNVTNDGYYVDSALVEISDVVALNGIINTVPQVLVPPWYYNSIYALIENSGENFTTAIKLINEANLTYTLNNTLDPITFIVPDNDAFAAVGNLSSYSISDKTQILLGHLFYDIIFTDELVNETIKNGITNRWTVTSDGSHLFVNGGALIFLDNFAVNGVVHSIDKVLLPPSAPSAGSPPSAPTGSPPLVANSPSAPAGSPTASNGANNPVTSGASLMGGVGGASVMLLMLLSSFVSSSMGYFLLNL